MTYAEPAWPSTVSAHRAPIRVERPLARRDPVEERSRGRLASEVERETVPFAPVRRAGLGPSTRRPEPEVGPTGQRERLDVLPRVWRTTRGQHAPALRLPHSVVEGAVR